jgi:ankyrin repeat protein
MIEVERGCPVDLKDTNGNTLLSVAAQNGHKSLIKVIYLHIHIHTCIHIHVIMIQTMSLDGQLLCT